MGKTYKDKPDKWRRNVQRRPKGPKNGTLNHVNDRPDDRWKPMGGSAQQFLVGDETSFHD